ncbi:MAG: exo-alpha-sialidase [Chloroflexi bacterium]|nr:exo-alpha-sialidase [Chloroflexota bacterium]
MQTLQLNDIRIVLGQPQQVTAGTAFCWFPYLSKFSGGNLLLTHSLQADADVGLRAMAVMVSRDHGQTWDLSYDVSHGPAVRISLPDNTIAGPTFSPIPDPPGQWRNFRVHYVRYEAGGAGYKLEPWAARILDLPRDVAPWKGPSRYWQAEIALVGDAVKVDGRYVTTCPLRFQGDPLYSCVALASDDNGYTWRYLSTMVTAEAISDAREGFDEPCMLQLSNGDLMCVSRVGSGRDQALARVYSSDGGKSWSPPDRLPAFSVMPAIRRLHNGVIALSTGRPGIYLWLSTDPRGTSWQMVDIVAHHNQWAPNATHKINPELSPDPQKRHAADQTTAYTALVEIEPNQLLLVYDRIPFGWNGVPAGSDERSRIYLLPIHVERT